MSELTTNGYAAIGQDGKLSVRSVGPTEISAMVNYLVTDRMVMVTLGTTDDEVRKLWEKYKGRARIVPVLISYK